MMLVNWLALASVLRLTPLAGDAALLNRRLAAAPRLAHDAGRAAGIPGRADRLNRQG